MERTTDPRCPCSVAPPQWFTNIHIDMVGRLLVAGAWQCFLLTMIDRPTHWAETVLSAAVVAAALASRWIPWFGVPCTSLWTGVFSRVE